MWRFHALKLAKPPGALQRQHVKKTNIQPPRLSNMQNTSKLMISKSATSYHPYPSAASKCHTRQRSASDSLQRKLRVVPSGQSQHFVGEEIDGNYQVYEHVLKTKLVFKCLAIYNPIQHFGISPCN